MNNDKTIIGTSYNPAANKVAVYFQSRPTEQQVADYIFQMYEKEVVTIENTESNPLIVAVE